MSEARLAMEVAQIARSQVRPNPNQPRKEFDRDALLELVDSIRENGLLQPVMVRRCGDEYEIIAGERRFRALCLLDEPYVPCVILDGVDDERAFILATTENVARRDMTIIEEANAYAAIVNLGRTVDDVAKLFGKTFTYVQDCIDLLRLRPDFQHLVARRQLAYTLASAMTRLSLDGQGEVMQKLSEGRFPTNEDALSYAFAVEKREAQPSLMGPLFEPISEAEIEKRQRCRVVAADAFDRLNKLAAAYDVLLDLEPRDIAAVYGSKVLAARDRLQDIFLKANRAKLHLKAAAAAYELGQGVG